MTEPTRSPYRRWLVGVALLAAAGVALLGATSLRRDGADADIPFVVDKPAPPPVVFGDPVTTDLTRYGIRAVIDAPGNARVEAAPFGVVVRFPDGSDLSVETPDESLALEKDLARISPQTQTLAEGPGEYLVWTDPPAAGYRFRRDIPVGGGTVSATARRAGTAVTRDGVDRLWAAAQSLRQTDAQKAAEPVRAAAVAKLTAAGVSLTVGPGGGAAVRLPGRTPVTDAVVSLLAAVPDLTALEISDGERLSPAAFDVVRGLPYLRSLGLRGAWVTDALFVRLAGHPTLEDLKLTRTAVGDDGLVAVAGMAELRAIALTRDPSAGPAGALLSGPGLKHLAGLLKLRHLRLSGQPLTDDGLAHLPPLPDLRTLDLSYSRVTDAGLAALPSVDALETLDLTRTRVAGPGLARLAGAKKLESLTLAFTDVTDAGLAAGRGLPVRSLDLTATKVGDAGAAHLGTMRDLVALDLSATRVTDVGVREFGSLARLFSLNLRHADVTGLGLAALRKCPDLSALDLTGCPCGDNGLGHALALPKLARLGMTDTPITDDGVKLFERFPDDRPLSFTMDRTAVSRSVVLDVSRDRPLVTGLDAGRPDSPQVGATAPIPVSTLAPPNPDEMIRRAGGVATRDENSPERPVVALALSGDQVTDLDLADLRNLSTLKVLSVRSDRVTDGGLAYLAGLTGLEDLTVSGRRIVGDGFVYFAGMKNLRRLTLPRQPLPARTLTTLAGLTNLEDLDIPDDATASGPAALTLYASLPRLRRLDLKRVGNTDLVRLRPLTGLTDLRFQTQTERADRWGLLGLSGLADLRHLTVEGGIDDRGLAELAKLDRLESVEVTNGEYVTDEGAAALGSLPRLRRLAVPGSRITDAGLTKLTLVAPLEELDLSGSRVTDRGLAALPRNGLRVLNLSNTDVSDAAIPALSELKGLGRIVLRGTRVTAAGLDALRSRAPGLVADATAAVGSR